MRSAAIFAQPDEGGAIGVLRVGVTVERVHGDVGARAGEPLVVNAIPLENFVPGLGPDELACRLGPERVGILAESARVRRASPLSAPALSQWPERDIRPAIGLVSSAASASFVAVPMEDTPCKPSESKERIAVAYYARSR